MQALWPKSCQGTDPRATIERRPPLKLEKVHDAACTCSSACRVGGKPDTGNGLHKASPGAVAKGMRNMRPQRA